MEKIEIKHIPMHDGMPYEHWHDRFWDIKRAIFDLKLQPYSERKREVLASLEATLSRIDAIVKEFKRQADEGKITDI